MNAALKITAAVACAVLVGFTAGCSSKAPATYYLDPACPTAVAALPAHPPVMEKQALADEQAVDRVRTKGAMLRSMVDVVGFALSKLRLDITEGINTPAARVTYNADMAVVRIFCRARSK
jgi:hypothetical protein